VEKLNRLLVLSYAAGEELMAADLHIVPWLSHTLWGTGATGIQDFASLGRLVGGAVPVLALANGLRRGGLISAKEIRSKGCVLHYIKRGQEGNLVVLSFAVSTIILSSSCRVGGGFCLILDP
jgi:hypothetical protein